MRGRANEAGLLAAVTVLALGTLAGCGSSADSSSTTTSLPTVSTSPQGNAQVTIHADGTTVRFSPGTCQTLTGTAFTISINPERFGQHGNRLVAMFPAYTGAFPKKDVPGGPVISVRYTVGDREVALRDLRGTRTTTSGSFTGTPTTGGPPVSGTFTC